MKKLLELCQQKADLPHQMRPLLTKIGLGDFKRGYFIVDHETRTRTDNITEPGFIKAHTDKLCGRWSG